MSLNRVNFDHDRAAEPFGADETTRALAPLVRYVRALATDCRTSGMEDCSQVLDGLVSFIEAAAEGYVIVPADRLAALERVVVEAERLDWEWEADPSIGRLRDALAALDALRVTGEPE